MNTELESPTTEPVVVITDQGAAERSDAGHWAETQVIESIKEATFRHKDPRRALAGQATQPMGSVFHPVKGALGRLVTPKLSWGGRLRKLYGYFRG